MKGDYFPEVDILVATAERKHVCTRCNHMILKGQSHTKWQFGTNFMHVYCTCLCIEENIARMEGKLAFLKTNYKEGIDKEMVSLVLNDGI